MPAPKEAAKPDHSSRILDAASELFLELGFQRTSTADIAKRAKVSKRELYSHFADKRGILFASVTSLQKNMWSEMDIQWAATGGIRSVLVNAGSTIIDLILSERFQNVLRIVAAESFHDPVTARQFYLLGPEAGRQETAKFFQKQMKKGVLRRTDPLQAADHFLALVITARLMTAVVLGATDRVKFAKGHVVSAVDFFLTYYSKAAGRISRPNARGTGNGNKGTPQRPKAVAART